MEKDKYLCPQCGTVMDELYEKPALNLTCPKCGCKIATTRWDEIDLDDTVYELIVDKYESPSIEMIKIISKITGDNFLETKENLICGNVSFKGSAIEMKEKKSMLDKNNIKCHFLTYFPYN